MNEDNTDYIYTSLENSWDIHPNEDLLTKYWAAKEMGIEILKRDVRDMQKPNATMLNDAMCGISVIETLHDNYNYVTQMLKKEWFR